LRWLSIEPNEGSSHVFRAAEVHRLGDAFDKFARRLDPAAGEIVRRRFTTRAGVVPVCARRALLNWRSGRSSAPH
jgi:hypothetical protein